MSSADRTWPASPRRRAWAREQGRACRSSALTSSLVLLAGALALVVEGPALIDKLIQSVRLQLMARHPLSLNLAEGATLVRDQVLSLGIVIAWVGGAAWCGALLGNLLQAGWMWSPAALRPDAARVSPADGLQRLASMDNLANAVWLALATAVAVVATVATVSAGGPAPAAWAESSLEQAADRALSRIGWSAVHVAGALALVAVADALWRRRRWEQSLRMTADEARDELTDSQARTPPRMRSKS